MNKQHIGSLSIEELMQREKENRQAIKESNESQLCGSKKDVELLKHYFKSVEIAKTIGCKRDVDKKYLLAYQNYLSNARRYYLANGLKSLSSEQEDICLSVFAEECALIK